MDTAASSISLADLDANPYPIFDQLRASDPVAWIPSAGMWFVLRYDDCQSVLRDSATFTTHSPESLILDTFDDQMLSLDGTEHRRHRRPFNEAFSPQQIQSEWTARVEERVHGLIDRFGTDVELRGEFASPLAIGTVGELLGYSSGDITTLRTLYDAFAASLSNFARDSVVRQNGLASVRSFRARCEELLSDTNPGFLASLRTQGLDDHEIASNALIILFGGIETTESMILNAVWALLTHAQELQRVRGSQATLLNAIHESLRWDAAVQSCTRHTTRPVTLRGHEIPRGAIVQCMLGSANRDPDRFADPDRFDVTRIDADAHLTFGYGRHLCIGKHLAMLEASTALGALFDRFPNMELDHARSAPPTGHEFRKPAALWVHT